MSRNSVNAVARIKPKGGAARRYLLPGVLVSAITLATLAACSSSSSKVAASSSVPASSASSSFDNASCASAPGVTATTVKVGVTTDSTGALAANGAPFTPGAKAAIDQQNAAGGVNGRKIVEVDADGASTQAGELAAATGLVESNNVFAIVNGTASPLATQYEVTNSTPTFSIFASAPDYATAKNLFSIEGAFSATVSQAGGAVLFAKALGSSTVAVTAHNSQASIVVSQGIATLAEANGMKSVYQNFAIPFTSFDATSVAIAIKAAHPDAVFLELALPAAVSIVNALTQQGYTPKFIHIPTGYDPAAFTPGLVGTYATAVFVPYIGDISTLPKPAQDFRNAMAKYAPTATATAQYTVGGYATATLFMHALQLAGNCPTQASIVTAMRAVNAYNPAGLIPQDLQFSPGTTPDGNPQNCFFYPQQVAGNSYKTASTPTCQ